MFVAFTILHAIARAILEVWRRDDRGGFGIFSTSQLLGVALVAGALVLHRVRVAAQTAAQGSPAEG